MTFELFDPRQEVTVHHGNLPHWYQAGVTYFVTFRTEDSVPQPLARSWYARRNQWLRQNGIDPSNSDWKVRLRDNVAVERAFLARFTRQFMAYLDRGYGACPLSDGRLAKIVARALRHFDEDRYYMGDFIVMPNHVHLLVCLVGSTEIEAQCRSWKKFTATRINQFLGQRGRFWQEESFDHLVRTPEHFEYFRRYIAENSRIARLAPGTYLHYVRKY